MSAFRYQGVKGETFLKKKSSEDTCDVCDAHDQASDFFADKKSIPCPKCGKGVDLPVFDLADTMTVVGETNGDDVKEQFFAKVPIIECSHCNQRIALWPTPIDYNANHDIYYTGGNDYVPGIDQKILAESADEMIKLVKNFLLRTDAVGGPGENLDINVHLKTWLRCEVEHAIARYVDSQQQSVK